MFLLKCFAFIGLLVACIHGVKKYSKTTCTEEIKQKCEDQYNHHILNGGGFCKAVEAAFKCAAKIDISACPTRELKNYRFVVVSSVRMNNIVEACRIDASEDVVQEILKASTPFIKKNAKFRELAFIASPKISKKAMRDYRPCLNVFTKISKDVVWMAKAFVKCLDSKLSIRKDPLTKAYRRLFDTPGEEVEEILEEK